MRIPTTSQRLRGAGVRLAVSVILWTNLVLPETLAGTGAGEPLALPTGTSWLGTLDGSNMPVNIAPYAERQCFVTAYTNIHIVDLEKGTSRLLEKPEGVEVWNPTGVVYNRRQDRLYIANYSGRDVLVLEFRRGRLELKARFTSRDLRSPEGIAVSRSGDSIAVADYDGNTVVVFDARGQVQWERQVDLAHGICFSHDERHLLVTSLKERKILRLSAQGRLISSAGGQGWWENKYLWPTSIVPFGKSKYLVCDAHTGQLSLLNDELQEERTIGGNGPGAGLFNMPYHAIPLDDDIVVADAYKNRLVSFDYRTQTLNRALYWKGGYAWQNLAEINRRPYRPMGLAYDQYSNVRTSVNLRDYVPNLPDGPALPGYNSLDSHRHSFTLCGARPLLGENCFYFVSFAPVPTDGDERFLVLLCPQRSICFVLGEGVYAPVSLGANMWLSSGELVGDFGRKSLVEIGQQGMTRIRAFRASDESSRTLRVRKELFGGNPAPFENFFHTRNGRRFWLTCEQGEPDPARYFDASARQRDISLFEWCLVNALTSPPTPLQPVNR